ncbi:MAG: glycosyltransferase family 2 protein [bacterium]|nr:glycosyltransferase family 2 protein [bacterium]
MKSAIVLLYYNKPSLTVRCLDSILASNPASLCFAFDNGSEKKVHEEIRQRYPAVNHVRLEANSGYSGGFNRALERVFSEGYDSAFFLTNDTLVLPGALENCIRLSEQDRLQIIAPCIYYLSSPQEIDSVAGYFDRERLTLHHYREHGLPVLLDPQKDYVPGTGLWLTGESFRALKGMDESYHTYWEDADFSFRGHKLGIRIGRCYEAGIRHEVGRTCHKKPLYTTYYFQRNRSLFCRSHLSPEELGKAREIMRREMERLKEKASNRNDDLRLNYLRKIESSGEML